MNIARIGNKYLTDTEPWKLVSSDMVRVKSIIAVSLELSGLIALFGEPFYPLLHKS